MFNFMEQSVSIFLDLYKDAQKSSSMKSAELGTLIGILGHALIKMPDKEKKFYGEFLMTSDLSEHTKQLLTKYLNQTTII